MGAEIFDVDIDINNGRHVLYATKLSFKKNRESKTTLTFNGHVSTSAHNTGATISMEGLVFPLNPDEANEIEDVLENDAIKIITCAGTSYDRNGNRYRRVISGNRCTITSDDEDWAPADGMTSKLELKVDNFYKSNKSM